MDHDYRGKRVLRRAFFTVTILWACTPGVIARFTPYAKAVSLDTVPSLLLQKWKITNYRRNEPVYQLKCVSGCEFEPDWVKCYNEKGPAWRCEADLPSHLQFSTLEVLCEGYQSKDDTSILEGSCGLEYSLRHVELGSPNLRGAKELRTEIGEQEGDLQWGACQWLMSGMVIYVCCYCLYQVVQSDLKEAPSITHQKTAELSVTGRCGKCQSTHFSLPDAVDEKYHPDLQGWQNATPSEGRKANEEPASPHLGELSTTCNSRMREMYRSPPASPRSPRGSFLKKLDRPSRCRKRDEFDSPRA